MENNNSTSNKIGHPILGIPQKAGDSYVVKDRAIVGLVYTIVCPECHKHLLVKASSATLKKTQCKDCGTAIYYKGQERPTRSVATQRYKPESEEHTEVKASGTCSSDKEDETKEEPKSNESGETVKFNFGTPNAKIVWGSILRRNVYEIKHLGEYYIGRDDDEIKSNVMIADDFVSRRSLLLEVIPKGCTECLYKITVKHASNPILVNGKEIAIGESAYLNYGDTILVGNTTLTFKRNDQ